MGDDIYATYVLLRDFGYLDAHVHAHAAHDEDAAAPKGPRPRRRHGPSRTAGATTGRSGGKACAAAASEPPRGGHLRPRRNATSVPVAPDPRDPLLLLRRAGALTGYCRTLIATLAAAVTARPIEMLEGSPPTCFEKLLVGTATKVKGGNI